MAAERKSSSFLGHTATYAVGNIARRFVGFAMLPIYTRFLSPAEYGVIGLLTFALAFFEPLFGARLIHAVPKFYFDAAEGRERRAVIWSAVGVTCAVSVVSMTALILFRRVGSELLFGDKLYSLALGVFAVNLVSQPLENAGMMYLRLRSRSGLFLSASMIKLALQITLNLLLVVYLKIGVLGVVISTVISSATIGIGLLMYTATKESPQFDWTMARRMTEYCWPLWLSGLAGLYIGSSGALYLRVLGSLGDVGLLELGLRFAAALTLLVWTPFAQHWQPMSFQYYKEKDSQWRFQIAFAVSAFVMFAAGLGISVFSQPVIRLMAARAFAPAAAVVPILTLGFVVNNLISFFNFSFMATAQTKVASLCQYAIGLVITVAYVALIPRFGIVGAAWGQCIAFLFGFVFIWRLSRRYFDPKFNLRPVVMFAVIAAVTYAGANLLAPERAITVDLLVKSVLYLIAVAVMLLITLRSVHASRADALESLPWPLRRLGKIALRRTSDA